QTCALPILIGSPTKQDRNDLALELVNIEDNRLTQVLCDSPLNRNVDKKSFCISKETGSVFISLLGDTYFGEYYDRDRQRRGYRNYLEQYGYSYSLKYFSRFLAENDLNIVNFEASLTKEIESPLLGLKKWILDANPEKNIEVMRAYNIDAVLLGNNHSNDFGSECLASSLSMLDQADINNAGAGLNADLAATPMI